MVTKILPSEKCLTINDIDNVNIKHKKIIENFLSQDSNKLKNQIRILLDDSFLRSILSKREYEIMRFYLEGYRLKSLETFFFVEEGRMKLLATSTIYNFFRRAIKKIKRYASVLEDVR
jgi:hypothetical protein